MLNRGFFKMHRDLIHFNCSLLTHLPGLGIRLISSHLCSWLVLRLSMFRTLLQILPLKNGFLFLLVEYNKNLQTNNALMFLLACLVKKTSITYIKVASCLFYCFKLLVLKHLSAAKFPPEASVQIQVTKSPVPHSAFQSFSLNSLPVWTLLPLTLKDIETEGMLFCIWIRKEWILLQLLRFQRKWKTTLAGKAGGYSRGTRGLSIVTRTVSWVTVSCFGYPLPPSPKENYSSRKAVWIGD